MKKAGLAFAVAAWARESELIPSRLPFSDTPFKTASSSSGFTAFIYSSCTGFIESTHRSKSKTRTGPFINSCYWEMMLEMWMGSRCWPAMLENSFNLVEIDEKDSRLVRPEENSQGMGLRSPGWWGYLKESVVHTKIRDDLWHESSQFIPVNALVQRPRIFCRGYRCLW